MTEIHDPCPPPDAANYPYAQDFDGVWHRRPVGDEWIVTVDGPNCHTACGKAIPSVHVSDGYPDDLDDDETRCACCTVTS